ncbi:MAG: hypothetical protein KGL39_56770 [Patescibacteria group bacterium]|nr:hypothetical protein [Patescibacteria group bacterium]
MSDSGAADPTVNLHGFSFDDLAPFKFEKSFPAGASPTHRLFYVGRDDVHGILRYLVSRVTSSFRLNMFGYDDEELDAMIRAHAENPQVFLQLTLDKSQAGGVHERKILEGWDRDRFNSVAVIGRSATHQITHTKGGVIDGIVAFEGSTNWSASGEGAGIDGDVPDTPSGKPGRFKAQNNTLLVSTDTVLISEFTAELDREHVAARG